MCFLVWGGLHMNKLRWLDLLLENLAGGGARLGREALGGLGGWW